MGQRDSYFDHLRPRVNILDCTPYYEDRVLVKRLPQPHTSDTVARPGIADKTEGHQYGEVVSVGAGNSGLTILTGKGEPKFKPYKCPDWVKRRGKLRFPPIVKPGDKVIYTRVPPQEFVHEGETYTFCYEEQHILGIVE